MLGFVDPIQDFVQWEELMGVELQAKLWRLMNIGASDLCADYEKATPKTEPRRRLIARILTAAIFICLIVMVLVLYSTRTSQVSTRRYYGGREVEKHIGNGGLRETYCPCKVTKTRWTNYTSFYILQRNSSSMMATKDVIKALCNKMGFETNTDACPTVMQYCFGMINNELLSQQLIMPSVFPRTLGSYIQQSCTSQQRYWKLLLRTEALENNVTGPRVEIQECRSEECIFEPITRSLLAMHSAFQNQPENTTDDYFWEAPAKYYPGKQTLFNSSGIAFKMATSWSRYMQACDPSYCDVVTEISLARRFLTAIAQLGGILTIMLAGLRVFAWPVLVWAFAWDTHQAKVFTYEVENGHGYYDHKRVSRKRLRSSRTGFYITEGLQKI